MRTFGRHIYSGEITLKEADEDQARLLPEIMNFEKKTKPQDPDKRDEKQNVLKNLYNIFDGR